MRIIKNSIFLCLCLLSTMMSGQDLELNKPSEGKSLVYFIRANALAAGLNFRVYDKDKFLGALPSRAYYEYECEPGEHLFWAASENRDYVEATLEPNKTYVIDLRAKFGLVIAAVGLEPYSPNVKKHVKRIKRVLKKHTSANPVKSNRSKEKKENIEKALKAYEKIKGKKVSKIKKLLPEMSFN